MKRYSEVDVVKADKQSSKSKKSKPNDIHHLNGYSKIKIGRNLALFLVKSRSIVYVIWQVETTL